MSDFPLQRRLLTPLLSKKVPPQPSDDERKVYPKRTNPFSFLFFWWLHPIMKVGYKRTLTPADVFKLNDDIKVETMTRSFQKAFDRRLLSAQEKHIQNKLKARGETPQSSSVDRAVDLEDFEASKWVILYALAYTFRIQYLLAIVYLILANVGFSTSPLLTKKLILYVQMRALGLDPGPGKGVGYALGCSFMILILGLLINHTFQNSMLTGAQAKAVLTKALLDKSFKLNGASKHEFSASKITSMMGTDLARIDFALGFQPFLFGFPVPIAISIGILCSNIGASAMVGVGVIIAVLAVITVSMGKLFKYRKDANLFTDKRVAYMKEVLSNLKMIKYYSWETPYSELISESRRSEMRILYQLQMGRNIITSVAMNLTILASLASFLVLYAKRKSTNDPAGIFSSISLFNSLSQQVFMLPLALSSGSDAIVGVARVCSFLAAEEIDPLAVRTEAGPELQKYMESKGLVLKIDNGEFKWESFESGDAEDTKSDKAKKKRLPETSSEDIEKVYEKDPKGISDNDDSLTSNSTSFEATIFSLLKNINLEIKKGEFVAITGVIGSGKTSLLNAIAGFMSRTNGEIGILGSLLLCGVPWIQNATVKDNILFGTEFDEKKYKEVIYACSLESDLEILPAGDSTEIGERGITLSGGQKARINLARAVYADKDIVLLDDVLSAVDARVGKHIMQNCMQGLLKGKTRVLATHQLTLISSVDRVIFLNGDGTISVGTFEELKRSNSAFLNLMEFNSEEKDEPEEEDGIVEHVLENGDSTSLEEKEFIAKQVTRQSTRVDEEAAHYDYDANKDKEGKLIMDEIRAENQISFQVYKNFVKYGSGFFKAYSIVPVFVVFTALATFFLLFTNTWLSFWTEYKFPHKSNGFYIGLYVMFCVLSFIFLTAEFVIVAYLTNEASTVLNVKAVQQILHVPMSFMDTTPMGRILNRFTKDTDTLDNEIGNEIRMLFFFLANIIGVIVLCIIYLPWFAIAVPGIVAIFVAISNFYQASAREVKRLEATQRSLVYNNFSEILNGMDTIKAYKKEDLFTTKNCTYIDHMNESYYITIANQRWLAIHLDIVATLFAVIVSLLCVFRVFNISAASVGLLLSYVLQIAGQLSMLVRMYTQVENEMNSVERICEYAFDLPTEAPYVISDTCPEPSWPSQGAIRFENASLSYRPGLPLVLKNLNMDVKPSEKIGVCGRTGAGKSSIMAALFRLSELASGKIEIDGIDISTLGLNNLRSKLSIIPQDPVLFQGTIKRNLDPFDDCSEDVLWDALVRAGLIEESKIGLVKSQTLKSENLHKFHLLREVDDEGSNFSLGERQLISFARALVRGSKILILDEATSSVDYETDNKIQATIRREFADRTILCIAHRLKTILNYDRVLVLDKGVIQEFDTPWNLFNSNNSIFQQMCQKSNITPGDFTNRL